MFLLMLRCGLRVEEVARLTVDAVDYRKRQVFVVNGKGAKDRVVYLSDDARAAVEAYLPKRSSKAKSVVPRAEGTLNRNAHLRPWHPEEDRILCTKERT